MTVAGADPLEWGESLAPVLLGVACPILFAILLVHRLGGSSNADRETYPAEKRFNADLLLQLCPVLLLNVVYPCISSDLAGTTIAGQPLTFIALAGSVTVPWLAQSACLPFYRVLGGVASTRSSALIAPEFCRFWPGVFLRSLPLIALFAGPLWLATGWPVTTMATYAVFCVLHLVFVQSLVFANVTGRAGLWAAGWSCYALALLVAPTVWWLPPVAATLPQVLAMRSGLRCLTLSAPLESKSFRRDLVRGLLMGAVLWGDKYLLFVATDGGFPVVIVFAATLPSVIAYNAYFSVFAPHIDRAMGRFHGEIAGASLAELTASSRRLVRLVGRSVLLTGAVAALLTVSLSVVLAWVAPEQGALATAVAMASWCFLMLTLVAYQLDFIGEKTAPQVVGLLHVAVCATVFLSESLIAEGGFLAAAYLILALADAVLLAMAWMLFRHHWDQPEYTLFWRQATSW
jgi:hypothetical protein